MVKKTIFIFFGLTMVFAAPVAAQMGGHGSMGHGGSGHGSTGSGGSMGGSTSGSMGGSMSGSMRGSTPGSMGGSMSGSMDQIMRNGNGTQYNMNGLNNSFHEMDDTTIQRLMNNHMNSVSPGEYRLKNFHDMDSHYITDVFDSNGAFMGRLVMDKRTGHLQSLMKEKRADNMMQEEDTHGLQNNPINSETNHMDQVMEDSYDHFVGESQGNLEMNHSYNESSGMDSGISMDTVRTAIDNYMFDREIEGYHIGTLSKKDTYYKAEIYTHQGEHIDTLLVDKENSNVHSLKEAVSAKDE